MVSSEMMSQLAKLRRALDPALVAVGRAPRSDLARRAYEIAFAKLTT